MTSTVHRSKPIAGQKLAISWEDHRRTREICDWFQLPLQVFTFEGSRWQRYLKLSLVTSRVLFRTRPALVFVQNPSLVLALLTIALRPFCGRYRIIMDAHNEAVTPFAHPYWPVPQLARLALRCADITIVTNAALAEHVESAGGRPHVLPDRLPTSPLQPSSLPIRTPIEVMVVATYAPDEPVTDILEAARLVGSDYQFSFTGRKEKLPHKQRSQLPANVVQTGFLSEDAYWELMANSHFVLDLTLKPNCLVCGAYEALAMTRPMILTGNPATIDLFGEVAVFPADSSAHEIARALHEATSRYPELNHKATQGRSTFTERWVERATGLTQRISHLLGEPLAP